MRQALCVVTVIFAGCTPKPKPTPAVDAGAAGAISRSDVLRAAGDCALKTVTEFRAEATALANEPTKERWQAAMAAWQRAELMQFGPTGSSNAPGGQDFRDQIYSWPLVSRCAVDDVLVAKGYANGAEGLLVNRRGLAALEYLLFYGADDVSCGADAWNAVATEERLERRQAYAAAAAADVKTRADGLVAAWESGFIETLGTAGPGNSTYPTTQGAMNRLSDALFYLEREVKDLKLAKPMGLRECDAVPCLDALESQYAHHNSSNLRANLVGFRRLFEGCEADYAGVGFDDVLPTDLASRMREKVIAAQAALEAIHEPDLRQALSADPISVRAFYDSLKALTDLLKSEFVTVLDLELPNGLEGDND